MNITPHQAVKRMRELTDVGVCFSIKYQSYSTDTGKSKGTKEVPHALLRMGYRDDQSALSQQLISYIDIDNNHAPRMFHLPLLLAFNDYIIQP